MANVVVIGTQWGDEGKGKIVDWLSERADIVVRYQGGHNAGHTLVINDVSYKLSLLPSGLVRGKTSVIGNGVVIDPYHFIKEITQLKEQNIEISPENLYIAENAPLILSLHRDLDEIRENAISNLKIGTTKRGIGPAYEDKVGRRAIRLIDLSEEESLKLKIERLLAHHNALRRGMKIEEIKFETLYEELNEIRHLILPYMKNTALWLNNERRQGKRILFEGAQGAMLDIDFGTYPFVTSSNTLAGQAAIGSGIAPSALNYILGITKAYTTRVGEGPFPTEQLNEIGEKLGTIGHEFGVVTGRKRRCGWFDAVFVRQMIQICGITGIALTKLDVLDSFDEIKICTKYELDGELIDYYPSSIDAQKRLKPIYETFQGWREQTMGACHWSELPARAIKYIRHIEELIKAPVSLLSTSPKREDTILVKDPFED